MEDRGPVVGIASEDIKKDDVGTIRISSGGQILYTRTSLKKDTCELLRKLDILPREALQSKDMDLAISIILGFRVRATVVTNEVRDVLFELYEEGLSRA